MAHAKQTSSSSSTTTRTYRETENDAFSFIHHEIGLLSAHLDFVQIIKTKKKTCQKWMETDGMNKTFYFSSNTICDGYRTELGNVHYSNAKKSRKFKIHTDTHTAINGFSLVPKYICLLPCTVGDFWDGKPVLFWHSMHFKLIDDY